MHLYIDESFDPHFSYYVLAGIAVCQPQDEEAIRRVIFRTTLGFEDHLRRTNSAVYDRLPAGRVRELKGGRARDKAGFTPSFNDQATLRNRCFSELVAAADFRVYVLYYDHPTALRRLRWKEPDRRYGRLLQKLLQHVELLPPPPELRQLGLTVDAQDTPRARSRPPRQTGQSPKVTQHTRWWSQLRTSMDRLYPKRLHQARNIHIRVWPVESQHDRVLQAADLIANFCARYRKLQRTKAPYLEVPSHAKREWFDGFVALRPRMHWVHNEGPLPPRFVRPKVLPYKLVG